MIPITVAFPADVYRELKDVARRTGITLNEQLRKAAGLWLVQQKRRGRKP